MLKTSSKEQTHNYSLWSFPSEVLWLGNRTQNLALKDPKVDSRCINKGF